MQTDKKIFAGLPQKFFPKEYDVCHGTGFSTVGFATVQAFLRGYGLVFHFCARIHALLVI
jgi:hypothetical protein